MDYRGNKLQYCKNDQQRTLDKDLFNNSLHLQTRIDKLGQSEPYSDRRILGIDYCVVVISIMVGQTNWC